MKLTFTAICSLILLLNTGCSTTKTASKSSATSDSKGTIAQTEEKLPPVAEAPASGTWGRNISPYSY